jgi:hypothetical protein
MKRILTLVTVLALACAGAGPTLAGAPAAAPAAPAKTAKATTKPGVAKSGARLDEVHIKGEIPEPQVLFVVGRERRRFLDFEHRRYLAARASAAAMDPAWVRVVDSGRP